MPDSPRPFKSHRCHRCDRVFARREHLQRHERSHTKEKPFRCSSCAKGFTRRDLLTRHLRLTHEKAPIGVGPTLPVSNPPVNPNHSTIFSPWPVQSSEVEIPPSFTATAATSLERNPLETSHHDQQPDPAHGTSPRTSPPLHVRFSEPNAAEARPAHDVWFPEEILNCGFDPGLPNDNPFDQFAPVLAQDFGMFMDNVPSLTHPFSLTHQPLPVIISTDNSPLTLSSEAVPNTNDKNEPHERARDSITIPFPTPSLSDVDNNPSSLSRCCSRLPSLEPESWTPIANAPPRKSGELFVSAECRQHVVNELATFSGCVDSGFVLPSRHTLTRLAAGYFQNFHDHYPFFHVPTLRLETVNAELTLAIAALGARYTMEPELGVELYRVARSVALVRHSRAQTIQPSVSSLQQNRRAALSTLQSMNTLQRQDICGGTTEDEQGCVVQTMQTFLLLIAVASWYKHEPALADAISLRSTLQSLLQESKRDRVEEPRPENWETWIQSETLKRTHVVIFCFFNIHTILFDLPPMMLANEVEFDLPCSEKEWRADSEQKWCDARHETGTIRPGFQDAYASLFVPHRLVLKTEGISALGGHILIHAVIQQIWLVRNGRMPINVTELNSLSKDEMKIFERALKRWTTLWASNEESSMNPLNPHGPLPFTSTALLRLAYIRLNMNLGPVRSLSSWDPYVVANSLHKSAAVRRSDQMTRAALHCAHALSIPVKLGINYVARTQLIHWSNQHALCSLECAVLLAKWLESVTNPSAPEMTAAEQRVLDFVAQLLTEEKYKTSYETILEQKAKLSAMVVQLWAKLYQYKSVWQTVNLIAESLTLYAEILENDHTS